MATVKTTSGDYTITCAGGTGNMTINGDLAVNGNVTSVSNLAVDDAFITVAANNTGTVTTMGLVAQKSLTTYAGLRFNTVVSSWEISPSVDTNGNPISPYQTINTGIYGNAEVSAYLASGTNTANIVTTGNVIAKYVEYTYAKTFATTLVLDCNNGTVQTVTATNNFTLNAPTNLPVGGTMTLIIKQDSVGNRVMTPASGQYIFASGINTLTTTANAIDMLNIFNTGNVYMASLTTDYT